MTPQLVQIGEREIFAMGDGREGDWYCSGCNNRNYAFRSFCNRCKQPRLLVDDKTPADSKWLPRAGDWICTGCTNNNYASREKCKKCGQAKEIAAMPAVVMPGSSLPTYSHYLAMVQGLLGQKMGTTPMGINGILEHPFNSWSAGEYDNHGANTASAWQTGFPYLDSINQLPSVPKGWRSGDWICRCGFHNYSSRLQCKKCNAFMTSMPSALGVKRLASEDLVDELDNKRFNSGEPTTDERLYRSFDQLAGSGFASRCGTYASIPCAGSVVDSSMQGWSSYQAAAALPGKGATQWRDGDWLCRNCNNHNYKSRTECNRCKAQKPDCMLPVDI
ncbi:hypothetical protein SAY86_031717 [Trapa natans]|uniref:RanBP2-type domain-containing protein n=1 Tax=Trapa natans TaxID=22666 RepID=A0AAN7LT98_TRANT|nr:hypothetical protein SAY86_031717 [Trapa natans]